MKVRLMVPVGCSALLMMAAWVAEAGAQGGWVPPINPALAGQSAAYGLRPQPVDVPAAHSPRIPGGPVVPMPHRVSAAHIGPESDGTSLPVSAAANAIPRYRERPPAGLNPYIYVTNPGWVTVLQDTSDAGQPGEEISAGIRVGMQKADVTRVLGRPNAAVYESSGRETLIFDTATIIVQNGIVAFIR